MADLSEERSRIARELHDGIAQDLAAIGYALDSEIGRSDTSLDSRKALREIREQVTTLNGTVRKEIFRLRSLRELSPQQNLERELNSLALDYKIVGSLSESETGDELAKVLVELARNANLHGHASQVSIDIEEKRMIFENDGEIPGQLNDGRFGLVGITERLESVGWTISEGSSFTRMELGVES